MAYTIQGFVGRSENLGSLLGQTFTSLPQDFILIPANKSFRKRYGLELFAFLEDMDRGLELVSRIGTEASKNGKLAYIEAEFFGGDGMQGSIMFEHGLIVAGPEVSKHAINLALQFLGVSKLSYFDEFEALGLGKYRDVEDWPVTST